MPSDKTRGPTNLLAEVGAAQARSNWEVAEEIKGFRGAIDRLTSFLTVAFQDNAIAPESKASQLDAVNIFDRLSKLEAARAKQEVENATQALTLKFIADRMEEMPTQVQIAEINAAVKTSTRMLAVASGIVVTVITTIIVALVTGLLK